MPRPALAAALLLGRPCPRPDPGDATLNIGIGGAVTSVDPHFYNASPNNSLAMHLFDRLVERDARAQPYPGLAESWRVVSDTVWEFKLRPGVKWHDGRALHRRGRGLHHPAHAQRARQPRRLRRLRPRHRAGRGGGPADRPLPYRAAASAAADRARLRRRHLPACRRGRGDRGLQQRQARRSAPAPTGWWPTAPATGPSWRATTATSAGRSPGRG